MAEEVDRAGGRGRFVECDVTSDESVAEAVEAAVSGDGGLTEVVHNSTSGRSPVPVDPVAVSLADLRDHVAVSVRGAYLLARHAYPHLVASGGSMVLLTSEAGFQGACAWPPTPP